MKSLLLIIIILDSARNYNREAELGLYTSRGVWLSTIHLFIRFRAGQLSYSHII